MKKENFLHLLYCSLVALSILLTACGDKEKVVFEKKYDFANRQWAFSDSLKFEFDIADTSTLFDIVLDIQHGTDYPFQNLYTNIGLKFPQGEYKKQTVNIDLADNTGKWHGEGSGEKRQYAVNIQQNAFFNQTGKHVYTLEQFMRTDLLRGVESVSLKLIESKEKKH